MSDTTVLSHLKEGHLDQALDLLEQLRRTIRLAPGDPIPYDKLPILEVGEELHDFEKAWSTAYHAAAELEQDRMDRLVGWLTDLQVFPHDPNIFGARGFGSRPRNITPPPRRDDPPQRRTAPELPKTPAPTALRHRAMAWALRQVLRVVAGKVSPFKKR